MLHSGITARRLLAFCVDWLVIAVWGAALFAAVVVLHPGHLPRPGSAWHAEAIGFLAMTVPVVLYFSLAECSSAQATLGKRALGLRVLAHGGGRMSARAAFLRNGVKFAPWELGHVVANQAAFSTVGVPAWAYLPMVFSFLLPAWWVASILVKGRAPYDAVASAQVVRVRHVLA
ncbi:MAG TPA: RDD family protein [Rhodanobacteraceae bacterium]